MNLLGNDNDADRGQHAVDHGCREELAENSQSENAESNLQQSGNDAHCQDHAVTGKHRVINTRDGLQYFAELSDCACANYNQPGCRALDGQLGVAEECCQQRAHDGGKNSGDGRITTGE